MANQIYRQSQQCKSSDDSIRKLNIDCSNGHGFELFLGGGTNRNCCVRTVLPNSDALRKGLKVGDRIIGVNGYRLSELATHKDIQRLLQTDHSLTGHTLILHVQSAATNVLSTVNCQPTADDYEQPVNGNLKVDNNYVANQNQNSRTVTADVHTNNEQFINELIQYEQQDSFDYNNHHSQLTTVDRNQCQPFNNRQTTCGKLLPMPRVDNIDTNCERLMMIGDADNADWCNEEDGNVVEDLDSDTAAIQYRKQQTQQLIVQKTNARRKQALMQTALPHYQRQDLGEQSGFSDFDTLRSMPSLSQFSRQSSTHSRSEHRDNTLLMADTTQNGSRSLSRSRRKQHLLQTVNHNQAMSKQQPARRQPINTMLGTVHKSTSRSRLRVMPTTQMHNGKFACHSHNPVQQSKGMSRARSETSIQENNVRSSNTTYRSHAYARGHDHQTHPGSSATLTSDSEDSASAHIQHIGEFSLCSTSYINESGDQSIVSISSDHHKSNAMPNQSASTSMNSVNQYDHLTSMGLCYIGAVPNQSILDNRNQSMTMSHKVNVLKDALVSLQAQKAKAMTVRLDIFVQKLTVQKKDGQLALVLDMSVIDWVCTVPENKQYFAVNVRAEHKTTDQQLQMCVCHVFAADPQLNLHSMHHTYAKKFDIQCTRDETTGYCHEFPYWSVPVLQMIGHAMNTYRQQLQTAMRSPLPIQRAAVAKRDYTSTSDSGVGGVYRTTDTDQHNTLFGVGPVGLLYNQSQQRADHNKLDQSVFVKPRSRVLANQHRDRSNNAHQSLVNGPNQSQSTILSQPPLPPRALYENQHMLKAPPVPERAPPPRPTVNKIVNTTIGSNLSMNEAYNLREEDEIAEWMSDLGATTGYEDVDLISADETKQQACTSSTLGVPVSGLHTTPQSDQPISTEARKLSASQPVLTDDQLQAQLIEHQSEQNSLQRSHTQTQQGVLGVRRCTLATVQPSQPMISVQEIENTLRSPTNRLPFQRFLEHQLCCENLNFWLEVETYRSANESERAALAHQMHERYISDTAQDPVNLDSRTKAAIKEAFNQKQFTQDLFNTAQYQIFHLLRYDCWPRFLRKQEEQEKEKKESDQKDSDKANESVCSTGGSVKSWKDKFKFNKLKKHAAQSTVREPSTATTSVLQSPATGAIAGDSAHTQSDQSRQTMQSARQARKKEQWQANKQLSVPADYLTNRPKEAPSTCVHVGEAQCSKTVTNTGCSRPDVVPDSERQPHVIKESDVDDNDVIIEFGNDRPAVRLKLPEDPSTTIECWLQSSVALLGVTDARCLDVYLLGKGTVTDTHAHDADYDSANSAQGDTVSAATHNNKLPRTDPVLSHIHCADRLLAKVCVFFRLTVQAEDGNKKVVLMKTPVRESETLTVIKSRLLEAGLTPDQVVLVDADSMQLVKLTQHIGHSDNRHLLAMTDAQFKTWWKSQSAPCTSSSSMAQCSNRSSIHRRQATDKDTDTAATQGMMKHVRRQLSTTTTTGSNSNSNSNTPVTSSSTVQSTASCSTTVFQEQINTHQSINTNRRKSIGGMIKNVISHTNSCNTNKTKTTSNVNPYTRPQAQTSTSLDGCSNDRRQSMFTAATQHQLVSREGGNSNNQVPDFLRDPVPPLVTQRTKCNGANINIGRLPLLYSSSTDPQSAPSPGWHAEYV